MRKTAMLLALALIYRCLAAEGDDRYFGYVGHDCPDGFRIFKSDNRADDDHRRNIPRPDNRTAGRDHNIHRVPNSPRTAIRSNLNWRKRHFALQGGLPPTPPRADGGE